MQRRSAKDLEIISDQIMDDLKLNRIDKPIPEVAEKIKKDIIKYAKIHNLTQKEKYTLALIVNKTISSPPYYLSILSKRLNEVNWKE